MSPTSAAARTGIENAPAVDASPLHSNQMCDVVVIGSGIAGLLDSLRALLVWALRHCH